MKKYTKPTVFEKETLHLNENIAIPYCEIDFDYRWQNQNHDTGTGPNYGFGSKQEAYDASFNTIDPIQHSGEQGVVGPIHKVTVTEAGQPTLVWYWEDFNADMKFQGNAAGDPSYTWYPDYRYMHGLDPNDPANSNIYKTHDPVWDNLQGIEGGVDWQKIIGPISGLIIRS